MLKFFLIVPICFLFLTSSSQLNAFAAYDDETDGFVHFGFVPLFDSVEIRQRGIGSAYIIYHPASWAEYDKDFNPCNCPYTDTLAIYVFNSRGQIIQHIKDGQIQNFDSTGNLVSSGRYYKETNKTKTFPLSSRDTSKSKSVYIFWKNENGDSSVKHFYLERFSNGFDTTATEIRKYNLKGQLLEIESFVNEKYSKAIEIHPGDMRYHYGYNYDESGRLIYYRDFSKTVYKKISYPYFGRLIEIFDVSTGKFVSSDIKILNEKNGITTVTFPNRQIILTALEKGSKLFKLRTLITPGEQPLLEYHEIVYK